MDDPVPAPSKIRDPLVARITGFLVIIGLPVSFAAGLEHAFLPGIAIQNGTLMIDEAKLLYPGDLLHEAGRLAMLPPSQRAHAGGNMADSNIQDDGGLEMAAIAWSYAAALHLGIPPAVVFHEAGYRGGSKAILENFAAGRYIGVPMWSGQASRQPAKTRKPSESNPIPQCNAGCAIRRTDAFVRPSRRLHGPRRTPPALRESHCAPMTTPCSMPLWERMSSTYTVAEYLADLRAIRATGAATAETSYYPPIDRLFNASGQKLKPAILFSTQLRNQGAGMPDGGFFPQPPSRRRKAEPPILQNPERGVVEIKPADYSLDTLTNEPQTLRYLKQYGSVFYHQS